MNTNKKNLIKEFKEGRKQLDRLSGQKKLVFLHKFLKTARLYSDKTAEELIDKNIVLIEKTHSEESAFLLGQKAFFCFQNALLSNAEKYSDKALTLSRDISSAEAETKALVIKGYINDVKGQHKKVVAWYTMALEKCSNLQKSGILLDMGTSYSKQGEYDRALAYMNEAIKHTDKLIHNKSISNEDKTNQIRIQVETWSRLGVVYESIGDFDGAKKTYNLAIETSNKRGLIWEHYKALSRKVKLLIRIKSVSEAEKCLIEAQKLPLDGHDPRSTIFVAHDWTKLYRAKSQYSEAMDKYAEILFGTSPDNKDMEQHLSDLIKYQTDIFGEILSGINECLIGLGKERLAEKVASATRIYHDVLTEGGIYKEADKQTKLMIQERNIITILETVFQKMPLLVRYKDIIAEYDPVKEKAKVIKGDKKFTLNKRSFLILKYLYNNIGECVTREELEQFWMSHGEAYQSEKAEETGIRTYIQRDIRKKLGLDQFLKNCAKQKGGWRLLP